MGTLAPPGSAQAEKPFSKLVLPSPHDPGMNKMQTVDAILQKAPKVFLGILKTLDSAVNFLFASIKEDMLVHAAPNIIRGLAFTQKDSVPDMLAIGVDWSTTARKRLT